MLLDITLLHICEYFYCNYRFAIFCSFYNWSFGLKDRPLWYKCKIIKYNTAVIFLRAHFRFSRFVSLCSLRMKMKLTNNDITKCFLSWHPFWNWQLQLVSNFSTRQITFVFLLWPFRSLTTLAYKINIYSSLNTMYVTSVLVLSIDGGGYVSLYYPA